ncbi:MAG: hypothetical protein ACLTPC_08540 [Lacrimispora saccharolytica]
MQIAGMNFLTRSQPEER